MAKSGGVTATLLLDDNTTVIGGSLTVGNYGTLDVEFSGTSTGKPDATLDDVVVNDNSYNFGIEVGATTAATLLLEDDTTVYGGRLSIGSASTLDIEAGANHVATLDGVNVTNAGNIQIDAVSSPPSLLSLDDNTLITGGTVTIGSSGTLDVVTGSLGSGSGATLDGVTVTSSGGIDVDPTATGAILTLDDGASINGGTLTIGSAATLEVVYGSENVGATLDNVSVSGSGTIQVGNTTAGDPTLTLEDGTTISGGTLAIGSGDRVDIEAGPNNGLGATLDGVNVVGTDLTSTISVGNGSTIALTNSTLSDVSFSFSGTGDTIDLTDVAYSSNEYVVWTQSSTANGGSGTLQLYSSPGVLESTFNLSGIYSQSEFSLGQDSTASHGTDVNFNNPNYNGISFSNGTINTNGNYTPQISEAGSAIELTNGNGSEATSWFASNVYSIADFTASFDYVATGPGGLADGLAFILQNSSAGVNALGGSGSALGYGTDGIVPAISSSAAVEFNLFSPYVQGTAFETDGATAAAAAAYNPTGSVAFWNGDAMHVVLSYNGSVLTETLTDLTNGATYSTSYTVDLAADVGAGTAYVGFSAATGAVYSTQTVSNFTFADLTVTIDPVDGNNVITLAEAQAAAGVPLSGTVTGLAANSTFQVTVTDEEVTKSYTATVNAAGTAWTATIPSSDATALANGTATVSAQVTDANGNQSLLATQLVTVDETPVISFTDVWTNALGGSWTTPANWSTGVPGAADVISLPLSSGETVTVSSGTNSVGQIVETGAGGTLAITGGSLSVSAQSDLAGSLLIGGGVLNLGAPLGVLALTQSGGTLTGSGTLTVAGAATLTASVSAESGTGTTLVEGGASITANNSLSMTLSRTLELQGTSTVTGANGGLIGLGTTGTLKIDSGCRHSTTKAAPPVVA